MTTIHVVTLIRAPTEICFRLALSIDLELSAARQYQIEAIEGVTKGIIRLGQHVTWKTKQFGLWVRHTSEITKMKEPEYFQDAMKHGVFRSFHHDHFFRSLGPDTTEMRDELRFSLPAYLLGEIAEKLIAKQRLEKLLLTRNSLIKQQTEMNKATSGTPSV
ncbi:MAG TPA: SRPBCC family protein [Acidobacteriaceae bacterium]|nr:SRPBCC family protein [Acidobacteriaceae bacterium]